MSDSLVSHILYRVPKKNHDAMLQLCKEAYEMLKQHGILHYDVFKLSNTDAPMDRFDNIANTISANQDEEVGRVNLLQRSPAHERSNVKVGKRRKNGRIDETIYGPTTSWD
jgi:uncharacterized protein YbaA (DUF1428 family)